MANRDLRPVKIVFNTTEGKKGFSSHIDWGAKVFLIDCSPEIFHENRRYDASFIDPLRPDTVVRVRCRPSRIINKEKEGVRVIFDFCHRR
ncbi:MAG: hypothetical protein ACLFQK_04530 [Fibrobacterota bacterium]